jgi:hypothetical protein
MGYVPPYSTLFTADMKKSLCIGLYSPLSGITYPKYKLLCFLMTIFFYKQTKVPAFNRDRCRHLALCLQLILFHMKKSSGIGLYCPLSGITYPKYILMCFLTTLIFYSQKKALAFNRDRCRHLTLCLRLILFCCTWKSNFGSFDRTSVNDEWRDCHRVHPMLRIILPKN